MTEGLNYIRIVKNLGSFLSFLSFIQLHTLSGYRGTKLTQAATTFMPKIGFKLRSPWVPERSVTIAHNIEGFTEQYQENRQKGL